MASIKIYSKEQTDALLPTSEQLVPSGGSTGQVLTKSASGTEWSTPASVPTVQQSTGQSTTDVMSQKAVTDNLPSSSQLVPLTTGASVGDVLAVGSSGTEWVTPSSGGLTEHTYSTWTELFNDVNSDNGINSIIASMELFSGKSTQLNNPTQFLDWCETFDRCLQ